MRRLHSDCVRVRNTDTLPLRGSERFIRAGSKRRSEVISALSPRCDVHICQTFRNKFKNRLKCSTAVTESCCVVFSACLSSLFRSGSFSRSRSVTTAAHVCLRTSCDCLNSRNSPGALIYVEMTSSPHLNDGRCETRAPCFTAAVWMSLQVNPVTFDLLLTQPVLSLSCSESKAYER